MTHNSSRYIVLFISCGMCFFIYFGLRATSLSIGLLTLISSPLVFLIFVAAWKHMRVSSAEFKIIFLMLYIGVAFGFLWKSLDGVVLSPGAVASVILMTLAYLGARAIVAVNSAFYFSSFAFWIVAVPALIASAQGNALQLEGFFINSSENYLSAWLIITAAAMASSKYRDSGNLSYLPFIVTAFISFQLFTRGSISVSMLALIFLIYMRFGLGSILFAAVLAALIVYQNVSLTYDVALNIIERTKFGLRGLESPRWEMWSAYLRDMDGLSFLIGVDPNFIPEIQYYSGNPHNSLIRFHAYFGIIPLLTFAAFISFALWRGQKVHVFFLIIVLLRAATDILMVGMFFDIFFMIILVNLLESKGSIPCTKMRGKTWSLWPSVPGRLLKGGSRKLESGGC